MNHSLFDGAPEAARLAAIVAQAVLVALYYTCA